MLIEFKVGNFRSFHEPQTLSLVAGTDAKHPDNLISCGKSNLLKSAAVYGANASGKSNLIKALDLMRAFVRYSATRMNLGDVIPVGADSPPSPQLKRASLRSFFPLTACVTTMGTPPRANGSKTNG